MTIPPLDPAARRYIDKVAAGIASQLDRANARIAKEWLDEVLAERRELFHNLTISSLSDLRLTEMRQQSYRTRRCKGRVRQQFEDMKRRTSFRR